MLAGRHYVMKLWHHAVLPPRAMWQSSKDLGKCELKSVLKWLSVSNTSHFYNVGILTRFKRHILCSILPFFCSLLPDYFLHLAPGSLVVLDPILPSHWRRVTWKCFATYCCRSCFNCWMYIPYCWTCSLYCCRYFSYWFWLLCECKLACNKRWVTILSSWKNDTLLHRCFPAQSDIAQLVK